MTVNDRLRFFHEVYFGWISSLGVFSIFIAGDMRHVSPQIVETLGEHEDVVCIALPNDTLLKDSMGNRTCQQLFNRRENVMEPN